MQKNNDEKLRENVVERYSSDTENECLQLKIKTNTDVYLHLQRWAPGSVNFASMLPFTPEKIQHTQLKYNTQQLLLSEIASPWNSLAENSNKMKFTKHYMKDMTMSWLQHTWPT